MQRIPRKESLEFNFGEFLSLLNLKDIIDRHIQKAKDLGWDPTKVQCGLVSLTTEREKEAMVFMPITGAVMGINDDHEIPTFFCFKTDTLEVIHKQVNRLMKEDKGED